MSYFIDRRSDGSFALFVDGDLQFDSRDEHIYHECLVAPALALAEARFGHSLSVLIVGGGDGLAAREVLKSQRVETIDLVDLNQQIVELAKTDTALSALNCGSFSDSRVTATIGDAWDFIGNCQKKFDVILSDLTVPQTQAQTRMHSVEWYSMLVRALSEGGTIAVNAASICQTPRAFWSIVNSVRKSGLSARPYRIALPSFAERGYGPDWGFVLASSQPIIAEAMRELPLFQLAGSRAWERLFAMPQEAANVRLTAPPVMAGSNDLLDSFRCHTLVADPWVAAFNSLYADLDAAPIPDPVGHQALLPHSIKDLLLSDEAIVFDQILAMMPALGNYQTPETMAELLSAPSNLLATIDLPALIDSLLARAAELPRKAIEELTYLKEALTSISFGEIDAARLSARVMSVIALVVIIGNLVSPDVAYAKATVAAHAASCHSSAFHAGSSHAGSPHAVTIATFHPPSFCGHHGFTGLHPCRSGNGFRHAGLGSHFAINVCGNIYPARHFHIYSNQFYISNWQTPYVPLAKPPEQTPVYVLGGYSYIMRDGTVAILLDDNHSLLLSSLGNTIVDIKSGEPLLHLCPCAEENAKVVAEIDDQLVLLREQKKKAQERIDWANNVGVAAAMPQDQLEITNIVMVEDLLQRSRSTIAPPEAQPLPIAVTQPDAAALANSDTESALHSASGAEAKDAVAELQKPEGAEEMFPGVWVDAQGRYAMVHLPDGSAAYITGKGWYRDRELTRPHDQPFPHKFQKFLLSYTKHQANEGASATSFEEERREAASTHLETLLSEKADYQSLEEKAISENAANTAVKVHYGTMEIPVQEALTRITTDIASAEQQIVQLNQQTKENMTHINMLRSLHETLKHRG